MSEAPVTVDPRRLGEQAAALRAGFDHSFAEPGQMDASVKEDLLAVRVGNDAFAIRLTEITGLHTGKKVTRVPGSDPALLGIAGFRGVILPVYSLATLLGLPATAAPRWLIMAAGASVALAFDTFEHHLCVASNTIRPRDESAKDHPYVRDFVCGQQFVRPILHLPSILDAIRMQRPAVAPGEERLKC
jgi:purine-binding chemotaxis protein CheW